VERIRPHTKPLGMLEWESVARGFLASDALLKAAEVEILALRPVTPGRFVALFTGSVEAVRESLGAGAACARDEVRDSLFLAQPHPDLVRVLRGRKAEVVSQSVGIIETTSLCSALLAADGAAKCALVRLLEIRLGMGLGGNAFVTLAGPQSDVESALAVGEKLARERGYHRSTVLIPNPDQRLRKAFEEPVAPFSDFTSG